MDELSKLTGLPEEIFAEESIKKETQIIKITVEKRKFGKEMTLIKGISEKDVDIKSLLKTLKQKLACGGSYKDGVIELQGNHKEKVKELLIKEGFNPENIEIE